MSILASKVSSDVMDVQVLDAELVLRLADGRIVSAPLAWFPRLLLASPAQRARVELTRVGLHWDEIEEDISVPELLAGRGDMTRRTHQAA